MINNTHMKTLMQVLKDHEACKAAIKWLKDNEIKSIQEAWSKCDNPDWMLWLDKEFNLFSNKQRRLIACSFVRETPISDSCTMWNLLEDERSRNAVVVAEKYAIGQAAEEDLSAAWTAANSAVNIDAYNAAWSASWDAWATTWPDPKASAWDNTDNNAWATQCDIIRSYTPDWSKFEEATQ